jgi:hypothetical protein
MKRQQSNKEFEGSKESAKDLKNQSIVSTLMTINATDNKGKVLM